jgi:ribosome-binding ATPase
MSLSIGIVGFPNVGKSTLFKAITRKEVECSNYAFCTIDPNVGIVSVPDSRIQEISKVILTKKKTYPTIEFVDIAGLVQGASQGKGLGNRFLSHIRETNLVVYVLRAFKEKQIVSTRSNIDPLEEAELLETELALKDMELIDKRIYSLEKEKRAGRKEAFFESETLIKAKEILEQGKILFEANFTQEEEKIISLYSFLTFKPRIYLVNGKQEDLSQEARKKLSEKNFLVVDVKEIKESEIDVLVKEAYKLLNLITFFTAGPEEIRAWKIKKGSKAPEAGGVIHSDFHDKFIKAVVVDWQELVEKGGFAKAKKRLEGKNYVVQDGDVIEIKHGA